MASFSTLAELAAIQGDKDFPLKKPLSEGAYAELTEAMRLLNVASRRIDASLGAMQNCRVPVDVRPFRHIMDCLDHAFASLCHIPLQHAEAVARERGERP